MIVASQLVSAYAIVIEPGVADAAPNVTAPLPEAYSQDESLASILILKVSPVAKDAGLRKPKIAILNVGAGDKLPVIGALITKVLSHVIDPKVLESQPVSSMQATTLSVSEVPDVAVIVKTVPTEDRNASKLVEDVTSNE